METETKTEGEVDTSNNPEEGTEEETVTLKKADYDTLNQTLGSLKKELKTLKKSQIEIEPKGTSEKKPNLQEKTDYGLLAYLNSEGIKHADDRALFTQYRENTGKDPEDIIGSKHFQADLADLREKRESLEAQPTKNNRGGGGQTDEVTTWAQKVESGKAQMKDVPPALTYQVIQKRIALQDGGKTGSDFLSKIKQKQSK